MGTTVTIFPIAQGLSRGIAIQPQNQYILVGGQNGTWFKSGQAPRLYRILLSNHSVTRLTSVSSQGTVWGGSWNGSQWLISGWGTEPGAKGSNPYIYLHDGQDHIVAGTPNLYDSESSWHGGDIFAYELCDLDWGWSIEGLPTGGPRFSICTLSCDRSMLCLFVCE